MWQRGGLTVLITVGLSGPAGHQRPELTFSGIGLRSEFDSVASEFPHSERAGQYIYVSPEDSRDHIYGIGISGAGNNRFVRISFERQRERRRLEYPTCATVQSQIARQFGRPDDTRRFAEEATTRSDRLWVRGSEELTLMCFRSGSARLWAEAVVIDPIPSGESHNCFRSTPAARSSTRSRSDRSRHASAVISRDRARSFAKAAAWAAPNPGS